LTLLIDLEFILIVEDEVARYTPARSLATLRVQSVFEGLRSHGAGAASASEVGSVGKAVAGVQAGFAKALQDAFADTTVQDLLLRGHTQAEDEDA
jgi:hypothetical protein